MDSRRSSQPRSRIGVQSGGEQENDETEANKQQAASAREYDDKLEGELQKIYDGILALVDTNLNLTASTEESTVIYYKTHGGVEVQLVDEVVDMLVVLQMQVPSIQQVQQTVVDVPVVLRRQAPMIQEVLKTVEIAQVQYVGKIGDVSVVTKRRVPTVQTAQKTEEVTKVQFLDLVAGVPVVMQRQLSQGRIKERTVEQTVDDSVPQSQVAEETVEIAQLDVFEKIAETPQTQTIQGTQAPESLGTALVCQVAQMGPTESASAMFVSTPVPQVVEELVEASKAFSQHRVQQSSMELIIANPAISLAEKTVEMLVTRTEEKTQHVVNTCVQHAVNAVEAEKPIINETINQVTKHVEISVADR